MLADIHFEQAGDMAWAVLDRPKALNALDLAMDPRTPVHYWAAEELGGLLEDVGFHVHRHLMVDFLPYPHILYIAERRS